MDYGLSTRMQKAVEKFAPTTPPPTHSNPATVVDLSTAQNEVLRPELLEFFKSTIEDKATSNVFALPPGDGGDPQCRAALATFFNNYFNPIHDVRPEHIVLTAGASDAIEMVVHAVCEDGDSVLVPGPLWPGFSPMLKTSANVNIITASPPTFSNWDNYLAASLQAVYDFSADKSRIKAVLLCNPHNPLSRCYPRKVLLEVMEFCQEHGLHLIVDEIYALTDLNVGVGVSRKEKCGAKFVSALELTEPLVPSGAVKVDPSRVHVVWSASKLFGMSGFRIRLSTSYALLAALLTKYSIEFIAPSHGLFLFARLAKHASTAEEEAAFFEELRREAGIKVGEGRYYKGVEGKYGWGRVTFSLAPEVLQQALERLEAFLEKRRGG
ncbi:PLP-dependent transferase [Phaeosphaeriaceae sp. SRC1lsM3a]|nr:PLP-dependent transferase [Stagonospora sp. SRC1lsM3a]